MARRDKRGIGPSERIPGAVGGDRWSADPDRGLRGRGADGSFFGFLAFLVVWLLMAAVFVGLPIALVILLLNLMA